MRRTNNGEETIIEALRLVGKKTRRAKRKASQLKIKGNKKHSRIGKTIDQRKE